MSLHTLTNNNTAIGDELKYPLIAFLKYANSMGLF